MGNCFFKCPSCKQVYNDVEGIEPNQRVECGSCHTVFNVIFESDENINHDIVTKEMPHNLLSKQIINAENTYNVHITGVTFEVNFPIDFIPPITVI